MNERDIRWLLDSQASLAGRHVAIIDWHLLHGHLDSHGFLELSFLHEELLSVSLMALCTSD